VDALIDACISRGSSTIGASGHVERTTVAGGVFFLLPVLAEMPIEEATRDWPAPPEGSADAAVRWLVLATGMGRGAGALEDPVLRELCGVPDALGTSELAPWHAGIPPAGRAAFTRTMTEWARERDVVVLDGDVDALVPPVASARDTWIGPTAAILIRAWARRLPGFAASSIEHLRVNLLGVTATVVDEPERRVVRIARPPLALLLSMTGMLRATYRLPWLDERPIAVFPET
jgi:hypothetical protein